jgi:hypothetical protein
MGLLSGTPYLRAGKLQAMRPAHKVALARIAARRDRNPIVDLVVLFLV